MYLISNESQEKTYSTFLFKYNDKHIYVAPFKAQLYKVSLIKHRVNKTIRKQLKQYTLQYNTIRDLNT